MSPKLSAVVQVVPTLDVEVLLDTRASLKAQIDRLQHDLDETNATLLVEAKAQGGGFETEAYKVTAVPGKSADRVLREKLLALGVPLKTIRKATVPGKEYEYARVTPKATDARPGSGPAALDTTHRGRGRRRSHRES